MIRRVVCGMSGGVDSAVSALLLKKRGFQVVGAFMKNWDLRDEVGHCSSQADLEDAQHVCEHLEISLHQVDFVKEYWTHVFTPMIQEYEQGLTPNPDVQCNRHIKFGYFHEYCMKQLGADAVATGHYARNSLGNFLEYYKPDAEAKLLVPKDQVKDQTLFLCQIQQSALRRTMFPVGDLLKTQVKEIAKEIGLQRISGKKESMGICFIGSRYFHDFIEEYIEPKCGKFINIDTGKVMGEHKGVHYWTIGQRCQIGGLAKACFVVNMESTTNDILVAEGTHHPALYTDRLFIKEPYWIGSSSAQQQLDNEGVVRCRFRFQNLHSLMECTLHRQTDYFEVKLEHPLRAITAGQYAVFYEDDTCIGSSSILRPGPSLHDQGIQLDELTARAFRRTYAQT